MDKFTMRLSWLPAIQSLADAERGRLLTALLEYAATQEPKKLSGNERFVYDSLVREIDEERLVQIAQGSVQIAQDIDIENNSITLPSEEGSKNRYLLKALFEEFWKAYPTHVNKKRCIPLWEKIKPDEKLLKKMLDSIAAWKKSDQWKSGYIPNPDTWLRNEKWNVEVPPPHRVLQRRGPNTFFNYEETTGPVVDLGEIELSLDDL
jgi:hypothetical protein